MNQPLKKDILLRYQNGQATEAEKTLVDQWMLNGIDQKYELTDQELLADLTEVRLRLNLGEQQYRPHQLWPKIAGAAVIGLLITGIYFFSPSYSPSESQLHTAFGKDIPAGRNTATLTLADGTIIQLDTSKTGVVVTDSVKTMTMLTASTPRGGTYQVKLPDGTEVWLNADSKITFPSQFTGEQRSISLQGEAYFQVAKDKNHPFIVNSRDQQVEVLGTHFNINSYDDETSTTTTLTEGSVRVAYTQSGKVGGTTLKPGQQSVLSGQTMDVRAADLLTELAWKNGDFVFDDENLESIVRKIEKWYDVQFIYQKGTYSNLSLSGRLSRSNPISSVLFALQEAGKLKFKIEGRRVTIM